MTAVAVVRPESSFIDLLAALEKGGVLTDCDAHLAALGRGLREAQESGKTKSRGTITVTIAITDDEGVLQARGEVAHKVPKRQRFKQLVHLGANGTISPRDSRQADLFPAPKLTAVGGTVA